MVVHANRVRLLAATRWSFVVSVGFCGLCVLSSIYRIVQFSTKLFWCLWIWRPICVSVRFVLRLGRKCQIQMIIIIKWLIRARASAHLHEWRCRDVEWQRREEVSREVRAAIRSPLATANIFFGHIWDVQMRAPERDSAVDVERLFSACVCVCLFDSACLSRLYLKLALFHTICSILLTAAVAVAAAAAART